MYTPFCVVNGLLYLCMYVYQTVPKNRKMHNSVDLTKRRPPSAVTKVHEDADTVALHGKYFRLSDAAAQVPTDDKMADGTLSYYSGKLYLPQKNPAKTDDSNIWNQVGTLQQGAAQLPVVDTVPVDTTLPIGSMVLYGTTLYVLCSDGSSGKVWRSMSTS